MYNLGAQGYSDSQVERADMFTPVRHVVFEAPEGDANFQLKCQATDQLGQIGIYPPEESTLYRVMIGGDLWAHEFHYQVYSDLVASEVIAISFPLPGTRGCLSIARTTSSDGVESLLKMVQIQLFKFGEDSRTPYTVFYEITHTIPREHFYDSTRIGFYGRLSDLLSFNMFQQRRFHIPFSKIMDEITCKTRTPLIPKPVYSQGNKATSFIRFFNSYCLLSGSRPREEYLH
jgi:hypothetical protein